jgi:hypothetical protein
VTTRRAPDIGPRSGLAAVAALVAFLFCGDAAGQAAPPSASGRPAEGPLDEAPAALADDARGWEAPPGTDPTDAALLLPRLILTPPRLVLKALFWPVQHGLRWMERHAVIERVEDVLYNDARTAGIVPTFEFLSSQGPSIGANAFHEDLAGHGEEVSLVSLFGGRYVQSHELGFSADRLLGTRVWLETLVRFQVSPRLPFFGYGAAPERDSGSGLGPREAAVETAYRQTRLFNVARLGHTFGDPGGLVKLGGSAITNYRDFDPSERGSEPSTDDVYDTAQLVGFDRGVRTLELQANLIVDTRDRPGATASGLYLEVFGGGVPPMASGQYGHYGAELTGYFDLWHGTRVIALRAVHEAVLGSEADIPFSDLPRIGGPNRLRGYDLDRFRDEKTAVVTAEYHYPIHEYVAGSLFVDAGRAAPTYEELSRVGTWRAGGGGGVIIRSKSRVLFTLDLAYGDGLQLYFTTDPLRAFSQKRDQL